MDLPAWREAETTQPCDTHGTGRERLNPAGRLSGIVILWGEFSTISRLNNTEEETLSFFVKTVQIFFQNFPLRSHCGGKL